MRPVSTRSNRCATSEVRGRVAADIEKRLPERKRDGHPEHRQFEDAEHPEHRQQHHALPTNGRGIAKGMNDRAQREHDQQRDADGQQPTVALRAEIRLEIRERLGKESAAGILDAQKDVDAGRLMGHPEEHE